MILEVTHGMSDLAEKNTNHCCPFCSNHKDSDFIWSELADAYLCLGCYDEIRFGLDFQKQPTINDYNCADTIEKLLQRLGISYADLKERWVD